MGVKQTQSAYTDMLKEWEKCLDFMKSEKDIKARDQGKIYLPMLAEQDEDEYLSYKSRAPISMYAQRANHAMGGMITRKEAMQEELEPIQDLIGDIDSRGHSLEAYTALLLDSFLATGRGGTLVDVPKVEDPNVTVAQAEQMGVRPRFHYYEELNITNWRTELIDNRETLVLVVLKESIDELDSQDAFSWETKNQYRVLKMVKGVYWQQMWDDEENMVWETTPKMDGQFLKEIPFIFHGGIDVPQPPLNQVVDLNLHHYQLSADEIWGLRMAALPTPYFFGEDPESKNFPNSIGPGKVIGCEDVNAKAGFREFTGAGLAAVAAKLKVFEETISKLSVQMTEDAINKTATSSVIDYSNSTSSLSGISRFLSAELTHALKILSAWGGHPNDKIKYELNTDFKPAKMDPALFGKLLEAYLKGTITYETYYSNLAEGEITDPFKNAQEEKDAIDEALPPGLEPTYLEEDEDVDVGDNTVEE